MGAANERPRPMDERPRDEATVEARARLGAALRRVREAAGVTTRQVPKAEPGKYYSTTQISHVEAGKVAASLDLINAYIELGGDGPQLRALHQQAVAAAAADRRRKRGADAAETLPPRDAASVTERYEVQDHYVVVSQNTQYRFGPTGAIAEIECEVALRAKTPGVRLYYCGFSYPSDQRPGVLSAEPVSGARLADLRESETGAVAIFFELDEDLYPGDPDPFRVAYRVHVASRVRSASRLRYFADEGTERVTIGARFAREAQPEALWWFAAKDPIDAEYRVHRRELAPNELGRYERTFDELVPRWCYGLAWSW